MFVFPAKPRQYGTRFFNFLSPPPLHKKHSLEPKVKRVNRRDPDLIGQKRQIAKTRKPRKIRLHPSRPSRVNLEETAGIWLMTNKPKNNKSSKTSIKYRKFRQTQ